MKDLQRMLNDIKTEVQLTAHLIGKKSLDARVMAVMEQVPRHEFLPADLRYCAYNNGPAPIGSGRSGAPPSRFQPSAATPLTRPSRGAAIEPRVQWRRASWFNRTVWEWYLCHPFH